MTSKTISDSERDPSQSADAAQSPTDAAVDRLAELLPADALEGALKGLEPDDITAVLTFAALQNDHPVLRSA